MFQWKTIIDCPAAELVAAPAPNQVPAGEEGLILHLKTNARLVNELKWLRSEVSSFAARSGAELWRAKALLEAERAEVSGSAQLLSMEVQKNNMKTAEVAGLKSKLEESIIGKNDILEKCNMLNLQCIDLEAENERIMHELMAKEAMIKELSRQGDLKPVQPQENRWGAWPWLIPLTTVIVAAGTLVYVTR